jgi:hypothetical protein
MFDADPDPNFHFDADPDPDPDWHQKDADPGHIDKDEHKKKFLLSI